MTKEQILALIKKGSVTVTGLLKGEEVTSERIKNMEKDQFYENYVGHTGVFELDKDKKEDEKPTKETEPTKEDKTEDPKPTIKPTDPKNPGTTAETEPEATDQNGKDDKTEQPVAPADPEHPNTDNNDSKQDAGQARNGGKSSQEGNTGGSTKPVPKKPAATGKAKKPTTSK